MNIDASTLGTLATIETALLTFAFTVGSWVATLEFRVRHNARDLKANRSALEDAGRHHKAEMDTMRDNHKAEMEAMRTHHREEMADIRTHHREEWPPSGRPIRRNTGPWTPRWTPSSDQWPGT